MADLDLCLFCETRCEKAAAAEPCHRDLLSLTLNSSISFRFFYSIFFLQFQRLSWPLYLVDCFVYIIITIDFCSCLVTGVELYPSFGAWEYSAPVVNFFSIEKNAF